MSSNIADRGDPEAEQVAHRPRHQVGLHPGPDRLGAFGRCRAAPRVAEHRDVDVGVDEAGEDREAREVDDRRVLRDPIIEPDDCLDPSIPDEHGARTVGGHGGAVGVAGTGIDHPTADERKPPGLEPDVVEECR